MGRFTDSAGEVADVMSPYGTKPYVGKLPLNTHAYLVDLVPSISSAIKKAENNPRNHGVLSIKAKDPSSVVDNSVYNNYVRWVQAGRPGKFIDFMQRRWAPIGAKNDPDNLNRNWAPNVRKFLKNDPAVDYEVLRDQGIVMQRNPMEAFAV